MKANNRWDVLSIPAMFPEYADLRTVTSAVNCINDPKYVDPYSSNCDFWGRPFNYPAIWVSIFHRLRLGEESTQFLGFVLLALVSISLSYWCFIAIEIGLSPKKLIVFSGFLVAPSIYLLNERGNVDSVIFALLTFAVFLYLKNKRHFAVVFITIAAVLKVFPIVLLFTIIVHDKKKSIRLLSSCCGLFAVIYLFPFTSKIVANTPTQGEFSFGFASIIGNYFPVTFNVQERIILTFLLFVGLVYILSLVFKKKTFDWGLARLDGEHNAYVDVFLLLWPMFVFIYVSLTSFNYRLIFIVPIVALLLRFNCNASTIAACLFMPYVILAILMGPSTRVLDYFLLIATAYTTLLWFNSINSSRQENDRTYNSFLRFRKLPPRSGR